jgi:hypothetical protein
VGRVIGVNILRNRHVISAILLGCSTLIYNTSSCYGYLYRMMIRQRKPRVLRGYNFRISGSWHLQTFLNVFTRQVKRNYKDIFRVEGIEIDRVVRKQLYWLNFPLGGIRHAVELNQSNNRIQSEDYSIKPGFGRKLRIFAKFVVNELACTFQPFAHRRKKDCSVVDPGNRRVLFLIKSEFEIIFLRDLVNAFAADAILIVYGHVYEKCISAFPGTQVVRIAKPGRLKWNGNLLKISSGFWEVMNMINEEAPNVKVLKDALENYITYNAKILVVVEGENFPVYSACKQIVSQRGVKVLNVMNGMKAGEGHDSDVDFDYWAMWDKQMVDFFRLKCRLPQNMLVELGHLKKDGFTARTFRNTIALSEAELKDRRIVSVFLSGNKHGSREEIVEDVFGILNQFSVQYPDLFVLVKPHPSATSSTAAFEGYFESGIFKILKGSPKDPDQLTFDAIHRSTFVITFGSTVSLMSQWLDVPCINFEENPDESLVYYQGDKLRHVHNISDLKMQIGLFLSHPLKREPMVEPVLPDYISFIRNTLLDPDPVG